MNIACKQHINNLTVCQRRQNLPQNKTVKCKQTAYIRIQIGNQNKLSMSCILCAF